MREEALERCCKNRQHGSLLWGCFVVILAVRKYSWKQGEKELQFLDKQTLVFITFSSSDTIPEAEAIKYCSRSCVRH